MSLVHMDIKPGNIFISHDSTDTLNEDDSDHHHDSADDGFDEHDDQPSQLSDVVYKIGHNFWSIHSCPVQISHVYLIRFNCL